MVYNFFFYIYLLVTAEHNNLCNFGQGYYGENLLEVILNLDQSLLSAPIYSILKCQFCFIGV